MGNQIKFTPREKDNSISSADGALELENIQLKNTNRKLISRLDQQKQEIKTLTGQLEKIQKNKELMDYKKLITEFQNVKKKNETLENLLIQSKKEISKLKKDLNKLTKDSGESKHSTWDKLKKIRK